MSVVTLPVLKVQPIKQTIEVKPEEKTIENLKKLKTYWEQDINSLPTLDMKVLGGIHTKKYYHIEDLIREDNTVNICGTSCCLLGSCVDIFPIDIENDFQIIGENFLTSVFSYELYGIRLFPKLYLKHSCTDLWVFLFGSEWISSIELAIERLSVVIELGVGHRIEAYYYALADKIDFDLDKEAELLGYQDKFNNLYS